MKLALLLVAACTSAPPATYGTPVACDLPVSAVCPGADCLTLDGELHNTANCGGPTSGYTECDGGWTIITAGDMYAWDIYFKDGAFYGYIVHDHTAPPHCTVGPDSFAPPSCMGATMKLPVCP
jgi:hypothetical protein